MIIESVLLNIPILASVCSDGQRIQMKMVFDFLTYGWYNQLHNKKLPPAHSSGGYLISNVIAVQFVEGCVTGNLNTSSMWQWQEYDSEFVLRKLQA